MLKKRPVNTSTNWQIIQNQVKCNSFICEQKITKRKLVIDQGYVKSDLGFMSYKV